MSKFSLLEYPGSSLDYVARVQLLLQAYDKNLVDEDVLKAVGLEIVDPEHDLPVEPQFRLQLAYMFHDKNLITDNQIKDMLDILIGSLIEEDVEETDDAEDENETFMKIDGYIDLLNKMDEWADYYRANSATFSHAYDFAKANDLVGVDAWKYVSICLANKLDEIDKRELKRLTDSYLQIADRVE